MVSVLPAVVLGVVYAYGVATAARHWPVWRTACAMASVALLAVGLGPLDGAADGSLTGHMVQHAIVGVLAPALLALSAPIRLALAAPNATRRRALAGVLRATRSVLAPATAVALAAATVTVLHLPAVMDAVQRHATLHALDHAALFWTATCAWSALLGADPVRGAPGPIGLLIAVAAWMAPMALVGAVYANADHLLVAAYAGESVADQRDAGTLMILGAPLLVVPFALGAMARALWLEEDRQRRRERAEELRAEGLR